MFGIPNMSRTTELFAAGIGIGVITATLGYTFLFRDVLANGVGFSSSRLGFYSSANACVPNVQGKNADRDIYFVSCGGIN